MLPNCFYNNNYQIVQTPDHVMILVEMVHDARIIRHRRAEHPPTHIRHWMGDSIGRWEGDTLVVETTNFHPAQTSFRGAVREPEGDRALHARRTRTRSSTSSRSTIRRRSRQPWSGEVPMKRVERADLRVRLPRGQLRDVERALGRARAGKAARRGQEGDVRRLRLAAVLAVLGLVSPAGAQAPPAAKAARGQEAVERAAHARRQAGPPGQLDQRDDHPARARAGRQARA